MKLVEESSCYVIFIVKGEVSHLYKTTGKIVFLYILILMFIDNKLEDKGF